MDQKLRLILFVVFLLLVTVHIIVKPHKRWRKRRGHHPVSATGFIVEYSFDGNFKIKGDTMSLKLAKGKQITVTLTPKSGSAPGGHYNGPLVFEATDPVNAPIVQDKDNPLVAVISGIGLTQGQKWTAKAKDLLDKEISVSDDLAVVDGADSADGFLFAYSNLQDIPAAAPPADQPPTDQPPA